MIGLTGCLDIVDDFEDECEDDDDDDDDDDNYDIDDNGEYFDASWWLGTDKGSQL